MGHFKFHSCYTKYIVPQKASLQVCDSVPLSPQTTKSAPPPRALVLPTCSWQLIKEHGHLPFPCRLPRPTSERIGYAWSVAEVAAREWVYIVSKISRFYMVFIFYIVSSIFVKNNWCTSVNPCPQVPPPMHVVVRIVQLILFQAP